MKKQELVSVIQKTPDMVPLFKVILVSPRLASLGVAKGDTFYHHRNGCFVPVQSGCTWNTDLGASQVEFVEYVDMNKTLPIWHPSRSEA